MAVPVTVDLNPNTKKVDAAFARLQAQARGINFGEGARSLEKLSRPLGKITGQANEFQKSLEASNARVLAFGASVAVINKLSEAMGALVSNTIKVEASFAKIGVILGGTQRELDQFGKGIFNVAKNTATSFDEVAEGALELARQGLSVEETLSRVETALKLVRVAGIDSEKAVAGLTAAIKGFENAGITVAAIGDKLAEVDTKFAVSTEDLINGLERASASARVAGVSFDELISLVTVVQERTQRGGAVIGNAFKTIFARLGRTDTLAALEDLGIKTLDANNQVRDAVPLFEELATKLNQLGLRSEEASEVIQKVAGVRQRDILISLVEDLTSGQSQFAKSLNVSASAAGALDSKNEKLNRTLEALLANLTTGSQELAATLGNLGFTDAASDIVKGISSVVGSLTEVLQGEDTGAKFAQGIIKGIGSVITGPGVVLISSVFLKLFADLAKFGGSSLKQLLGMNKASEQQNLLQQSVLQTLLQNENVQREILALEGNKIAQEQLLLKIFNQQAAALARVQKAAATVSPGLFSGGFRGGEGGVTKRAAGGYIASEKRDVARGVGGAPASSKVVSIPNFAFGGGQRGTMIANSSEYYVPNYAGGGDAIFNQDMARSMGLPKGAKKLNASGGYVPNFVSAAKIASAFRTRNSDSEFISRFGREEFNSRVRAQQTGIPASERRRKAERLRAQKAGKSDTTYDPRFAMVVPIEGATGTKSLTYQGQKIAFDVVGYGGNPASRLRNDEDITKATQKFALGLATSEAKKMGGPPQGSKISKLANTGAISALAGTIFETSVSSLLNSKEFDLGRDETASFDFTGKAAAKKLRNTLFPGLSPFTTDIEAKIRPSKDSNKSMAGKILKKLGKAKASGGYIPNFAQDSLQDAIDRERAAGLKPNQIRINQSGKLRNAQNPQGLAVTNTRDEPTGRIPNFNQGGQFGASSGGALGGTFALFALQGVVGGFVNNIDEANEGLKNLGSGLQSALNGLIVLNTVGLGPSGLANTFSKLGKNMGGFGDAIKKLPLGSVATGFVALDSIIRAGTGKGVVGSVQELIDGLSGKTVRESVVSAQRERLSGIKVAGPQDNKAIENFISTLNDAQNRLLDQGDFKGFDQLILLENEAVKVKNEFERVLKTQRKEEAAIQAGTKVTRSSAVGAVRGFFGSRETQIQTGAAQKSVDERLKLLKAISEVEKANIQISLERIENEKQIASLRNEALQGVSEEVLKSSELTAVEKDKLAAIFDSIDANTTAAELQKTLSTEIGISVAKAGEIAQKAKETTQGVEEEKRRREELLQITSTLLLAEAERADLGERNTKTLETQLRTSQKAAQIATLRRGGETSALELELGQIGGVSSQREKEIQFRLQEIQLSQKLADAEQQAADARTRAAAAQTEFNRTKLPADEKALSNAAKNEEVAEENLRIVKETVQAQKELNEARKNQTPFERGIEGLDTQIKKFGADLAEDIPGRFANNLGNAFQDAVSGAKDVDEALSAAGRNFLGFIRDAFLQQAANQFTSSLAGSLGGLFGGAGGGSGTGFKLFNQGGPVGTDTVPAMLTPGEFIVSKSAVDKYGTRFLEGLNNGTMPMQAFQNGGVVSPVGAESSSVAGTTSVTNNSDFTFNIDNKGQVQQENGENATKDQKEFAARIKSAVTTIIQEESRRGGTLGYLYNR